MDEQSNQLNCESRNQIAGVCRMVAMLIGDGAAVVQAAEALMQLRLHLLQSKMR